MRIIALASKNFDIVSYHNIGSNYNIKSGAKFINLNEILNYI